MKTEQQQMETHIDVLGWLYVISHAFFASFGTFIFMILMSIRVMVDDPVAEPAVSIVAMASLVLFAFLMLPGLVAGFGLLKRKPWARVLALVVGFLNIINFPFGTALATYTFIVLFDTDSADYFPPPISSVRPALS